MSIRVFACGIRALTFTLIVVAIPFASITSQPLHSAVFAQGDYDADAEDVSLSLSTVYEGQSTTISVQFRNQSSAGAGTFDLRLAVDPPGSNNTVYYEWENEAFPQNDRRTFTQSYTFSQEGTYRITAEVYDIKGKDNGWVSGNRFDSHSENFKIEAPDYDADAEDVSLSPSSVYVDQSANISVRFQNDTESSDGAGTFDLRLAVDPPGSNNTVYYEWENEAFTEDQRRTFTQSYTFSQEGTYRITAEVYDIKGKDNGWVSGNRFDSHSENFKIEAPDYDADAEDVSLSSSAVYVDQSANISVRFQNDTESSDGAGTFDLRLAVDPPGSNNTVYYEWEDEDFTEDQRRTFTQSYTFSQEGTYRITAEVYDIKGKDNGWVSGNRFDSHSENFKIEAPDYDADAEDVSLSPSSVYVDQSATISVQFQNDTESSDGAGTFDLRLAVDPPGSNNTVYYEWEDEDFTEDQRRTFTQSYTFSQEGTYRIHGRGSSGSNNTVYYEWEDEDFTEDHEHQREGQWLGQRQPVRLPLREFQNRSP